MFVPEGGEAVISGYEKILAGDMRQMVERWTVRFHVSRELIPEELGGVGDRAPGCQRPAVDIKMLQLGGRSAID